MQAEWVKTGRRKWHVIKKALGEEQEEEDGDCGKKI
jgi:hypothetical protein